MIEIENAENKKILQIPSEENIRIDASGLTLLPGLVDPHVHLRTPGAEYKEDWKSGASAAIHGGFTTVFDMPNNSPACVSAERLDQKCAQIDEMLREVDIPLNYHLYFGADKNHFEEIPRIKGKAIGYKVFMGSSTGDLMMDDLSSLHAAFALASAHDLVLSVHAEDEAMIRDRQKICPFKDVRAHSFIRNADVAVSATTLAISLAKQYKTKLNILHVSTKEELVLIKKAKEEGIDITAETAPHYLFLSEEDYETLGTKVQMNPSLKGRADSEAIFEAINSGVIDMIGSDHAPHTLDEKTLPYGKAPSGVPGLETTLPLLLNACSRGKLTLERLIELCSANICKRFNLEKTQDFVLVDLNKKHTVIEEQLHTKCRWSPYAGRILQGWPVYTIINGKVYHVDKTAHATL